MLAICKYNNIVTGRYIYCIAIFGRILDTFVSVNVLFTCKIVNLYWLYWRLHEHKKQLWMYTSVKQQYIFISLVEIFIDSAEYIYLLSADHKNATTSGNWSFELIDKHWLDNIFSIYAVTSIYKPRYKASAEELLVQAKHFMIIGYMSVLLWNLFFNSVLVTYNYHFP